MLDHMQKCTYAEFMQCMLVCTDAISATPSLRRLFDNSSLVSTQEIAAAITAETPAQTSFNFYDWAYVLTEIISGILVIAITLAGYVFHQNRRLKAELAKSQQHEDRLRTLYTAIEQSPVSVVIAGVDAYIRYVNPQFTEVTGYTPTEVIGQNPRILSSGLTSPAVYQAMRGAISKGVS